MFRSLRSSQSTTWRTAMRRGCEPDHGLVVMRVLAITKPNIEQVPLPGPSIVGATCTGRRCLDSPRGEIYERKAMTGASGFAAFLQFCVLPSIWRNDLVRI